MAAISSSVEPRKLSNERLQPTRGHMYMKVLEIQYMQLIRYARTSSSYEYFIFLHRLNDLPKLTFTELRGFHGAFATGWAYQQGALTLPDTWFRPPLWDLLVLQLLRPDSSNLPCLYSTFHLEYRLVLSRFYFAGDATFQLASRAGICKGTFEIAMCSNVKTNLS